MHARTLFIENSSVFTSGNQSSTVYNGLNRLDLHSIIVTRYRRVCAIDRWRCAIDRSVDSATIGRWRAQRCRSMAQIRRSRVTLLLDCGERVFTGMLCCQPALYFATFWCILVHSQPNDDTLSVFRSYSYAISDVRHDFRVNAC